MTRREELASSLAAGSCLIDSSSTPQSNLKSALLTRLDKFYSTTNTLSSVNESSSLEVVQLKTASEAIGVVERVQRLIDGPNEEVEELLLGTRDLSQLRTLLSIAFRWGTEPLLARVLASWPSTSSGGTSGSRIIDLTSTPEDYQRLSAMVEQLLSLVFPEGGPGRISTTLITETILHRHVADVLKPSVVVGWLPKSLSTESIVPVEHIRPITMRLMAILPPSEVIMALGNVMSSINSIAYVRRTCGYLLSRQLLRPEGVRGLCAAVFGDAENMDEIQLEKLQHIARVLSTPPSGMKSEEYFTAIIPRIIDLLKDDRHPAFKRAAAFALSQMLTEDNSPTANAILTTLHGPILLGMNRENDTRNPTSDTTDVDDTLGILTILIANSDPSPKFIQSLLSPIIVALYSHLFRLESVRTSDPSLKESARGLLLTWSKIASTAEAVEILWSIVESSESISIDSPERLALLTPEDLKQADESGELEPNSNLLNLYPDPRHFADFLKSTSRPDVLSDFFVRLLEAYRDSRQHSDDNPVGALLYLQLIIQMQGMISDGSSTTGTGIFKKPTQVLGFIRQALDTTTSEPSSNSENKTNERSQLPQFKLSGLSLAHADETGSDADSDDELLDSERFTADDEMTETAINLLLSLLEANEKLSARTEPILNEIFSLLEHHVLNGPEAVRTVAREARMVMTVRLAGEGSAPTKPSTTLSPEDEARQTYQQALKLLQDPILPVRAHGLLLLRQLVSPKSPPLEPALLPAIQEIFLQSIHDDDSYIFLNAVQGLAALVDRPGGNVLKKLVNDYAKGLDGIEGGVMSQQEVDVKLRLGEALSSVFRQCGDTLSVHGTLIVPPLLTVVRSRHAPTTLRTSSLSLLADCQKTQSLSLLPYFIDLSEGMNDLLQVEMVTFHPGSEKKTENKGEKVEEKALTRESAPQTMDRNPTSTNSKFPPLRRAALHFLSLLLQGTTEQIYESSFGTNLFPSELLQRLKITLSYISGTDEDMLVRVMARETLEQLAQLEQAVIGL
ncbi:hypothetical protein D9758_001077 [Tetrapyrgos nigripes]|uniref:RNA polymerase II assembly factor Rtp1 C-terminal domain-containing protein n=1 Tax=Tetrapyrgos nigripes TaxID=182062 RepID=A0A8H5GRC5_9AGAR|nr:hypothetical protein D9758_001077 [Tetrapyrgos nigripes]